MDAETIRLVATGFFTLFAGLGTAWLTTRAQNKNAREQRLLDERKWQHEHAGEIYASLHRALRSLKGHIHSVVYAEKRQTEADVDEGNRLNSSVDAELSRLMFVAGTDVTEPALKALAACRNLYNAAKKRMDDPRPEYEALWAAANNDYAKALEAYKNAAAKTLRIDAP